MILAIWGKDGVGKSTLAHRLGAFFAAHALAGVVNTDLTMPTLPLQVPKAIPSSGSLGRFIAGTGTSEIRPYLHQHPQQEGLFHAGLSYEDDFLTYEVGLEADEAARRLINQCTHVLDHVILDLSGPVSYTHLDVYKRQFLPLSLDSKEIKPNMKKSGKWKSWMPSRLAIWFWKLTQFAENSICGCRSCLCCLSVPQCSCFLFSFYFSLRIIRTIL